MVRLWKSSTRIHFCYAALESGLLAALDQPRTKEELIEMLKVRRPEFLDALLEVGLALKELSLKQGRYRIKSKLSKSLLGPQGDMLAAIVQADVTYYTSVYRHCAERMWGAPSGDYLATIGGIVARFAKFSEPFLRRFIGEILKGRDSARVLDLGCGSGVFLKSARQANPKAVGLGLDMDPKVVEQAQGNLALWELGDGFEVVCGDIRQPPPQVTGPYDLITLFNLVYYFTPQERAELFSSLRALLAPDGVLAVASNFASQGKDPSAANLNLATCSILGCHPLPSVEGISQELRDCGFTSVEKAKIVPGSTFLGVKAS
jgi:2-polyprenyl-3-methyl-5-hydroxy-6-metoxy-1,4-benzoquinol methylase